MAHLIGQQDTMFSANGITPWHGLGTVLDNPPSIKEAIIAAGLGWDVNIVPLFTKEGTIVTHQATVRADTGAILGVVGPTYVPIQNAQAFDLFEPMLENKLISLETAGSLNDNRRVWILARVLHDEAQADVVSGDEVKLYVLLSHSHDGTLAVRFGTTGVRVVCNNTMQMAHGEGKLIRVRHTKNAMSTLETLREMIDCQVGGFKATLEQWRALAGKKVVNQKDLEKYVQKVFNIKDEDDRERESRVIGEIVNLFDNGRGAQLPGVAGTAWAAYNAVNEYLNWERGSDQSKRMDQVFFGGGKVLDERALSIACDFFLKAA